MLTKDVEIVSKMDALKPNENLNFFIKEEHYTPETTSILPLLHRHPFYEIVFIVQGAGFMKIDFKDYPLEQGSLYLLSPTRIHWPVVDGTIYHRFVLRFDLSTFSDKSFFENLSLFNLDYISVRGESFTLLCELFENLRDEYQSKKTLKHCMLNNMLNVLLINIQRLLPNTVNETAHVSLFSALNKLLEEDHYKTDMVKTYAKRLKTPIKALNRSVKEYTGLSVAEYIHSKTMIEAKRLLIYTKLHANEIAYALGFEDTSYFSRFFRRKAGMSPLEFRKNVYHSLKIDPAQSDAL